MRAWLVPIVAVVVACKKPECPAPAPCPPAVQPAPQKSAYFDNTGRDDVLSGGVKMIAV